MNVQIENLPNCLTTMRVELPSERVAKAWAEIAKEYIQHARIPGFRPGKAPRALIEAKFKKDIQERVQSDLLSESCREAIAQEKLSVISLADIQDVEFGADKSLRFTATLVTTPTFELPEYKALPVTLPPVEVTDADVKEAIERFREQAADFNDLTGRPVQMDDFAVIDYEGTIDGQPISEVVPTAAKPLSTNTDFWIKLTPESFLPGFSEGLLGAAIGETREFDVEVPADFPVTDLQGRKLHYTVTVKSIKEKVLPEVDDAFAGKLLEGKTLADLEKVLQSELKSQKLHEAESEKRNQIMTQLISKVECELPESLVRSETSRMLSEIVRENQGRGVPDEVIKSNSAELIASAGTSARDRLKGVFVLLRIAQEEKISVSKQEFDQRIAAMAMRQETTPEKLRKQLTEAGNMDRLHEDMLTGKVLDFLASNVSVSTSAPEAAPAAE